jgi:hypothetical protein
VTALKEQLIAPLGHKAARHIGPGLKYLAINGKAPPRHVSLTGVILRQSIDHETPFDYGRAKARPILPDSSKTY